MKTIELTKDEVLDVMEDGKVIKTGNWKYGPTETYLFERDGSKYKLDVQFHSSEGLMMYGKTLTAKLAKPVEKTIIEWVDDDS